MKVELIDHSKYAETTIAQAAGLCYGKPDKDVSRIKRLKQHSHLATMRFAHAVFKVTDISRACQNQIVRSKHLDFLVESQRYVDQSDRGFVMPKSLLSQHEIEAFEDAVDTANNTYKYLIDSGIPKEDARAVLPANTMTSMYVSGNFQAWLDFLKLRVSKHAQGEVQQVAVWIWATLAVSFPLVFKDLKFDDKGLTEWDKR